MLGGLKRKPVSENCVKSVMKNAPVDVSSSLFYTECKLCGTEARLNLEDNTILFTLQS